MKLGRDEMFRVTYKLFFFGEMCNQGGQKYATEGPYLAIEFYLFVSHECMNYRGSTSKFRDVTLLGLLLGFLSNP